MITGRKTVDLAAKSAKMSSQDWEKIKGYMVAPEKFTEADIRVYEARLANNFPDRDGERFRKDVLKSFSSSIVGKSVLFGHRDQAPGHGRFIDASLEKMTNDEILSLIGPQPEKGMQQKLAKINTSDGGCYFMNVKFYMLADNPEVKKIDAGIVSFMSIGFRAPARIEVKEAGGGFEWKEYQNTKDYEAEALEGSFVFLGAQYGAETKEKNEDKSIIGGERMKVNLKSLALECEVDGANEQSVKDFEGKVDVKVAQLEKEKKDAVDALTEIKTAFGGDVTPDAVKATVKMAQDFKSALVAEAIKYGTLTELIAKDQVDARKAMLEKKTPEEIKVEIDTFKKVWKERNPQSGELQDGSGEKQKKEAVTQVRYQIPD